MTTQFQRDCPHCLSSKAGFTVAHQWYHRGSQSKIFALAICGVCNLGIVFSASKMSGSTFPNLINGSLTFPSQDLIMGKTWPSIEMEIPADTPASVENFYTQGLVNQKGARWDAAGAMFRKALDVSTKLLSPQDKKLTLFKRINKLVEEGLMTPAIGEWSHEIRIDGNEAVHDEDPESEEDVIAIQKFTEAFLRYAFTLPTLVAKNRAKRQGEDSTED